MLVDGVSFEKVEIPNGETIKVVLHSNKISASCIPPYGTSTGSHEVIPFVKGGVNRFPKIKGEFNSLKEFEEYLLKFDKPPFKKVGGNLVLGASVAFLRLMALEKGKELFQVWSKKRKVPKQLGKVVGGGLHANKGPSFQEFLIFCNKKFENSIKINKEFHARVGEVFNSKELDLEGGWIVNVKSEEEVLTKLCDLKDDEFPEIKLGVDIAASSFYKKKSYHYNNGARLSTDEQMEFVNHLIKKFKLFYVEDPFHEDDFHNLNELQKKHVKTLICGDDLLVTNPERLKLFKGRAAIVKPNQVGLLSTVKKFVELCSHKKIEPVFSHRSKESTDDFLADLSLGTNIIKIGIIGEERVSKINRLLEISEKLS